MLRLRKIDFPKSITHMIDLERLLPEVDIESLWSKTKNYENTFSRCALRFQKFSHSYKVSLMAMLGYARSAVY